MKLFLTAKAARFAKNSEITQSTQRKGDNLQLIVVGENTNNSNLPNN